MYGLLYGAKYINRFENYVVLTEDYSAAINLDLVKYHLKVDDNSTEEDEYFTLLTTAAINFCEKYTKRDIAARQYNAYLNYFIGFRPYEIRKYPITSIDSLQYYVDGTLTLLDSSEYEQTASTSYPYIYPTSSNGWPDNGDIDRLQAVVITFNSGYQTFDDIPDLLQTGILAHIANMYSNRGDCSNKSCTDLLPNQSKLAYEMCKVVDIWVP